MKRAYAYRLINSSEVIKNVAHGRQNLPESESVAHGRQNEPIAYQSDDEPLGIVIPKSERVAREVGKAPKELQPEVWKETVKRFGEDPTAKQVKEVVADLKRGNGRVSRRSAERRSSSSTTGKAKLCASTRLLKSDNYPDKQSTVGASCRDKPLITGNQKLVKQFEIGQLVKLQLTNFDGVDDDLKMANHQYATVASFTESQCSLCISMLDDDRSFIVAPYDVKAIDSLYFNVKFTAEQFIDLMSTYKTRSAIESAIKKKVLGN